jgi:S1-C subfamily serine protease
LRDELLLIVSAGQAAPVVDSGIVTGLRLGAPVSHLGLEAGDLVVAVDGRRVSSREMFVRLLPQGHAEVRLLVRRGPVDRTLRFVER